MNSTRNFLPLLACFFLSGVAALVYETAWTREFAFVFGTSELAVALVLAAYMGGLALGAAAIDRLMPRIRSAVLAYGLLELGIALSALCVPIAVGLSRALYVALFRGSGEIADSPHGLVTAVFYAGTALVILLIPTSMMGATLPLLAGHLVHEEREIGRRVAWLYACNTLGAFVGALLTAFLLLPWLGLRSTIFFAAGLNALAFLGAWWVARAGGEGRVDRAPARRPRVLPDEGDRWILLAMLLSGAISFGYEVVWVRGLGHLLGGSVQAFGTMLGSFLLGIAIGSALVSRFLETRRRAGIGFCLAQIGIALLSWLAWATVSEIPALARFLSRFGLQRELVHVVACLGTLFPPALCIGATFPLAVRLRARSADTAGSSSARIYSWNTLGSILGSLGAAFVLLPSLGFAGAMLLLVAGNLLLAGFTLVASGERPRALVVAVPLLAVALVLIPPKTPWGLLMASSLEMGAGAEAGRIEYLGVGRSATVLLRDLDTSWRLRTNGLPEADMAMPHAWPNSFPITRWLTTLPILARPDTKQMLVIGFGGGTALEVIPESVDRIDVVELEPEVVEASRRIGDRRWRDPLQDPRVRVHINDARNALLLADPDRVQLDAIVSQPSHPWSGGAAHLYTQEFFELVESRLAPDGVFLQWIGTGFVDPELLASLLAALQNVFEHVEVYQPPPGFAFLFVCSHAPIDMEQNAARALEESQEAFGLLGLREPGEVLSMLRLDEAGVRALAEGATPNRDGHNRLQVRSERLGATSLTHDETPLTSREPLGRLVESREDGFFVLRQLIPFRIGRLLAIGEQLTREEDRKLVEALAKIATGKRRSARRMLAEILESSPRNVEARAAMLALEQTEIHRGRSVDEIVEAPLSEPEAALVAAWREGPGATSRERWSEIDPRLAAIDRKHPLWRDAVRTRILWRLEQGDEESLRSALRISESSLGPYPEAPDLLLQARVAVALELDAQALDLLRHAVVRLNPAGFQSQAHINEARRIAREIPDRDDLRPLREIVDTAIGNAGS
jgi:spermidine synthase